MGISHVTVLGTGLSGLMMAWQLQEAGLQTLVLEGQSEIGGLAKTMQWEGFRFDLGPDHFYTTQQPLMSQMRDLMGQETEFPLRPNRIWFRNRWITYPLSLRSLSQIPSSTMFGTMQDYASRWGRQQIKRFTSRVPLAKVETPPLGELLDQQIMGEYIQKIRQHPSSSLRPTWFHLDETKDSTTPPLDASFSFFQQVLGSFFAPPITHTPTFHDGKSGFGSIAQRLRERIEKAGGEVKTNAVIRRVVAPHAEVRSVEYSHLQREWVQPTDYLLSSIPVPVLLTLLDPLPRHALIERSMQLRHHSMLFLCILLQAPASEEPGWSYFPEVHYPFFRVHYATPSSPYQVDAQKRACLVVEWIFNPHHPLAQADAQELFEAASDGLRQSGFPIERVLGLKVHRERQAIPFFDAQAQQTMRQISAYLTSLQRLRSLGQRGTFTPSQLTHTLDDALTASRQLIQESRRIQQRI